MCIEFRKGLAHMSILISLYAPIILNEAAYINVIEKTMNAQLPNHLDDSELF